MTIYRHVHKYIEHGTSLNRNLVASSRPRSGRPVENNDQVQEALEENPKDMVCQRNGLGLSKVTFNYIHRIDFKWHPYKMHVRHELEPSDPARRITSCRWLLEICTFFFISADSPDFLFSKMGLFFVVARAFLVLGK